MRRAAAIAIAALVGAGLATAYFARERAATAPDTPDSGVAPNIAPSIVPDTAARPETPVAERRPSVARPPPRDEPAHPAEPPPVGASDGSLHEGRPDFPEEHGDDYANSYLRVAERFRGEPRDPTAAVALERDILDRFAAMPGLELTTLEVECRTTTCRVRMVERPGEEFREHGGSGFQSVVQGFGVAVSTMREAQDGSTIFEWLLARDAETTQ